MTRDELYAKLVEVLTRTFDIEPERIHLDARLGDDVVRITSTTYTGDTLAGGGQTTADTLAVTGGGTVNLSTGVTVSGFENVTIDNSAVSANVFTAHNAALAISVSGGNVGATINLGTGAQDVTITGSGNDTVALGTGANVVNTGDGSDTVTGALATGDAVDLQAGNDTYTFNDTSTDGTVSGGAGGSSGGVTNVRLSGSG